MWKQFFRRRTPRTIRVMLAPIAIAFCIFYVYMLAFKIFDHILGIFTIGLPFLAGAILIGGFAIGDGYSAFLALRGKEPISFFERNYAYWWNKTCPNCGELNEERTERCTKCGEVI